MEDLYFEKELRRREKAEIEKTFENIKVKFELGDNISKTTEDVFMGLEDILDIYLNRKHTNKKEYSKIEDIIIKLKKEFTDRRLMEMYDKYEFSKEELEYIKIGKVGKRIINRMEGTHITPKYAVIDILLRKKIIENFGEESLKELRNIAKNELNRNNRL